MMEVIRHPERATWAGILERPRLDHTHLERQVAEILADIRLNGDSAVRKYTQEFDGVSLDAFTVPQQEISGAGLLIPNDLKSAIQQAAANIEAFHSLQVEGIRILETMPGVTCWRRSTAIDKVGLYIPGGSAPLFSTLLMLGIPARLAGCREVVLCTPPGPGGKVPPAILYTAGLVGIFRIFCIGGAQAIGAMAFGTQTVPAVYKIFGPGNQYVHCAKRLVNISGVGIDIPAGPTELAILADDSAIAAFIAADLLSQAEHGPDSQVMLLTCHEPLVQQVLKELADQLKDLPRGEIARKALENSRVILLENMDEAIDLVNEYAPEHLIISCREEEKLAGRIVNAGSIFLGNYAPESVGDYASGTNHTLPTGGFARLYSGVSVDSFVKKITIQKLTWEGLAKIGPIVETMAAAEGLEGHRRSVSLRLNYMDIPDKVNPV
ncbi:MAG TPA: histidinol dehydrogenase [Chitinophagaceae bacterium]|nr:histidinol dehydrogenase [Chitinophagaceae bacterium]